MTTISNNVMKKVSVIFWTRRLTSRRAIECYVLFVSTLGLFSFVSVPHVIANMPSLTDIAGLSTFMLSAFTHTHTVVQITLALMCVCLAAIVFDFVRHSFHRAHTLERVTFS